jgi:hypothetical protein
VREIDGLEPLKSELLGNAPVNPSLIQVYMMEVQQQQQAEMMQQQGAPQGPDLNSNYDYGQQQQEQGGEQADVRELEMAGAAPGQAPMAKAQSSKFMVVIEHGAEKPAASDAPDACC